MLQDSLVKGTQKTSLTGAFKSMTNLVSEWIEIWDYVGGLRFRGFLAGHGDQRSLFAFFDDAVVGKDLKPGYASHASSALEVESASKESANLRSLMALIELASLAGFDCTRIVACLSRSANGRDLHGLMRDLGWVGFELVTLAAWTKQPEITSDEWLFLEMEV